MEIYRRMPTWRKARQIGEAIEANDQLLRSGLRARYPSADTDEIQRRLMDLKLGPETAAKVYGKSPFDP